MKTSSCTRKPANAYLQMTTGSNRQRLQVFAFVRFDAVDICKFSWFNIPVKQIGRREKVNTEYVIIGNKVYFVDLDTGVVLEEFDYPV